MGQNLCLHFLLDDFIFWIGETHGVVPPTVVDLVSDDDVMVDANEALATNED